MASYKDKREFTKETLVQSFWELYENKPFSEITVKEISQRAGYYRSTFYFYFESVRDVLDYIEARLMAEAERSWDIAAASPVFFEDAVGAAVSLFSANAKYYRVLFSDHGDPAFVAISMEKTKAMLLRSVQDCSNLLPDDMELALEFASGGIFRAIVYWFSHHQCSEKELVHNLSNYINSLLRLKK